MNEKLKQNKELERKFFDRFESDIDYDVFTEGGYNRIIKEFIFFMTPLVASRGRLKVLDCGCGTGSFTSKFHTSNFDLYGIDISSGSIARAREKYPHIKFDTGDASHLNFPDTCFDVVMLSGLLHHFPNLYDVLKESYRVLKIGGILLCYDPNRGNPFMWLYRCKESPFYSSKGVTENERPLLKSDIETGLKEIGYFDFVVYSISGVTYKYAQSKLSFLILPLYNSIERMMDYKPLRNKFGSFLITFARK